MLRFFSLSSGSCGNCYYLGNETCGVIIDAGVMTKRADFDKLVNNSIAEALLAQ